MWLMFCIGLIVCLLFLYLPGFFLFRALSFSPSLSLALSPIITMLEYGILCCFLDPIGIHISWIHLFFPSLLLNLAIYGVARFALRPNNPTIISFRNVKANQFLRLFSLYFICSLVFTCLFFVKPLDGPESFLADNDTMSSLNTIRHYVVSGIESSFSGSYYPGGYSALCAMVCGILHISPSFATNILTTVLLAFTFPLSCLGFLLTLFEKRPSIVPCGCVSVLALSGFPWLFLEINPIGPNLLGYSLLPLGLMIAILFSRRVMERGERATLCLSLLLFLASCLFTHANTVFTLGLMLVPYAVYLIISRPSPLKSHNQIAVKSFLTLLFLLAILAIWTACFHAPFLSNVVNFEWGDEPALTSAEFVKTVLTLSYNNPAQFFASFLILCGAIYTLINREYLWITVSALLLFIVLYCDLSCTGFIRQFASGFWYTAGRRVYGAACIACIPLLSIGIYLIFRTIKGAIAQSRREDSLKSTNRQTAFAYILSIVFFSLVNYFPTFTIPEPTGEIVTTFGYIQNSFETLNKADNTIIDQDEREFLKSVKSIVGEDGVFNLPYDGSAFAFALEEVHTDRERIFADNRPESAILQGQLDSIATNAEVSEAARRLGVKYVLYLDSPLNENSTAFDWLIDREKWKGYLSVNEDTPGLELVLSEGDRKLYKIDEDLIR